jgi:hypothetical protein
MASVVHRTSGRCHCGAVTVELDLSQPPDALRVRACQCGFCRPRGTRTVTDANGHARIKLSKTDAVNRYRFGLKLADYLVCATCGTYAAAVQQDADRSIAVINVAGLDVPEFRGRTADPVSYDNETPDARLARRRSYWMPAEIIVAGGRP